MITLKNYQIKAVENLVDETRKLFDISHDAKQIVFKAPTGAGKTVIMSKYFDAMSYLDEDVCFLWISIGTGNLPEQSKNRINDILDGSPSCKLLEEVIPDGEILRNQIVVINWEKLNRKNGNNEWDNVLMRNGEKTNFHDVIGRTLEKRKIILVVDESHRNTDTKTSTELQEIIQPELTIHVSATPKYIPTQDHLHEKFVQVPVTEVIEEGVIKNEVLINDTLEDELLREPGKEREILELVLNAAFNRRDELKKAYEEMGKDINPLCLIQIPNSDKGEETVKELKPLLEERGVSIENGKLAVWLSKEVANKDKVEDINNPVEFMIFKMAVATGWDCPRAQILLKLREVKSEIFDIQTIGRILRMPERLHYENDLLNKAYIYTNNDDFDVEKNKDLAFVKWVKTRIREGLSNIRLTSFNKKNNNNMLIIRDVLDPIVIGILEERTGIKKGNKVEENLAALKDKEVSLVFDHYESKVIKGMSIRAEELDNEVLKKNEEEDTFEIKTSSKGINKLFTASLQTTSPRLYESFKSLWFKVVGEAVGISVREKGGGTRLETFYLNNQTLFESVFIQANEVYRKVYGEVNGRIRGEETFVEYSIIEPQIQSKDGLEEIITERYIFDKCYLGTERSKPEKNFEKFLESNKDKVQWWYKNEDSGTENFAVRYEYDDEIHGFYPDYLVRFMDGSIGIFETKDEKDRDGRGKTKAKAEALRPYLEEESERLDVRVWGGIVNSSHEKNIVFNENDVFAPYSDKPDEWKQLVF